jgi:hypothetical protein
MAKKAKTLWERLEAVRKKQKPPLTKYGFAKRLGMRPSRYLELKEATRTTDFQEISLQAMEEFGIDFIEPNGK